MKASCPARVRFPGATKRTASPILRIPLVIFSLVALTACEQNSFVPPPPPKVDVGLPVQRTITRYLTATGNTGPVNTVDLVAVCRVFSSRSPTRTAPS